MPDSDFLARLEAAFPAADGFAISRPLSAVLLDAPPDKLVQTCERLKNDFSFEVLIDIAGVDFSAYHRHSGARFAGVYQLLSLADNRRIRVRSFCPDDDFPCLPSVNAVWPAANWFEREAFDLFGIVFEGHEDLRRILTDYGFVGHPFRKDFPLSGHVEMRYDPEQKRVIYQPVSIERREITPRTVRDDSYGKE